MAYARKRDGKKILVSIDDEDREEINKIAKEHNVTRPEAIRMLIAWGLDKQPRRSHRLFPNNHGLKKCLEDVSQQTVTNQRPYHF